MQTAKPLHQETLAQLIARLVIAFEEKQKAGIHKSSKDYVA